MFPSVWLIYITANFILRLDVDITIPLEYKVLLLDVEITIPLNIRLYRIIYFSPSGPAAYPFDSRQITGREYFFKPRLLQQRARLHCLVVAMLEH